MLKKDIPPETFAPALRQNIQSLRDDLIQAVSKYAEPDYRKAFWQVTNTLAPYLGLWTLMILSVIYGFPFWVTLLLAVPASGFLVRIFFLRAGLTG